MAPAAPPPAPPMSSEGPMMAKQPFNNPNPPPSPAMAPAGGIGQQMAAHGRGPDSMLVHMAPSEVKGLQALAQSQGGSLTINPTTGLPEAGFLSSLLPMILGAALSPFITPMGAAAVVGAGYGLVKHDLKAGLMAGLSAFGGAGIGGAIGGLMGGAASTAATAGAGLGAAVPGTAEAAMQAATAGVGNIAAPTLAGAADAGVGAVNLGLSGAGAGAGAAASAVPGIAAPIATETAKQGLMGMAKGAFTKFGDTLAQGASKTLPGMSAPLKGLGALGVPRMLTTAAGTAGVMNSLQGAMTPDPLKLANDPNAAYKSNYAGPYKPVERHVQMPGADRAKNDSSEFQYFDNVNPFPAYQTASGGPPPGYPGYVAPPQYDSKGKLIQSTVTPTMDIDPLTGRPRTPGMAKGGLVSLKPGGFVMDARTVSELGNGNTNAGQKLLQRHGGEPIEGDGDGVGDQVPAKIKGNKGTQAAKVSSGEVKFSPEAVRKMGGAQKLYAIMQHAQQARASAGRGQDTGLRGLAA
jgi:hypothetical protein